LPFREEAAAVLADLEQLTMRTSEVKALRRAKGKAISPTTLEILTRIRERLAELARVLEDDHQAVA
jgi:hypothetical protein